MPDNETAYHAGDQMEKNGGNMNGVGIEMCVNEDGNYEQTLINAERLCARLLLGGTALVHHAGVPFTTEAALAKLYASEVAMDVTTKCVQIYGGYGYIREYPMERMMRDAKITEIYEGTSQVQRMVIAGQVLR